MRQTTMQRSVETHTSKLTQAGIVYLHIANIYSKYTLTCGELPAKLVHTSLSRKCLYPDCSWSRLVGVVSYIYIYIWLHGFMYLL